MSTSRIRTVIAALALALGAFLALASPAAATVKHEFEGSFDGHEAPSGPFGYILSAVAADASGGSSSSDVYVGYLNGSYESIIDKMEPEGKYAGVQITGAETPHGSLGLVSFSTFRPGSIAVDGSSGSNKGNLYVAETEAGVVDKFGEDGKFLCEITAKPPASRSPAEAAAECDGAAGSETGFTSIEPTGVAVDKTTGNLYVADAKNNVIDVFSPSGEYLKQISDSHISEPVSIALDASGELYVDCGLGSVVELDHTGAFLRVLNSEQPFSLSVVPSNDHVYVGVTSPKDRIAEYDASGNLLAWFGEANIEQVGALSVGPTGRTYAANYFGGTVAIFGPPSVVPNVTTEGAIGLTATTATLTGEVAPDIANGGGDVTGCEFEYGETTAYAHTVACSQPTPYPSPTPVSTEATGLTRGTLYHYRLNASDAGGAGEGEDHVFELGEPAVNNERSISRTTSATVKAQINPFGYETTCEVEYLTEAAYKANVGKAEEEGKTPAEVEEVAFLGAPSTPCEEAIPAGLGDRPASTKLTDLTIGTVYHYRFVATNQAGTTDGEDAEFSTFGIESFSVETLDEHGNPYVSESTGQPYIPAGGHPYEMKLAMKFTTTETVGETDKGNLKSATGNLKTVRVRLPAGLVGNPAAVPTCTPFSMLRNKCAPATQVGFARAIPPRMPTEENKAPVFNLSVPAGAAAGFGARFLQFGMVQIDASVRTGADYGVDTETVAITADEAVERFEIEFWGVPADEGHKSLRKCVDKEEYGCSSGTLEVPFLTNPTSCSGPLTATLSVDTWQEPGNFTSGNASMPPVEGCDGLQFLPTIAVRPSVHTSESPSGLHVDLHVRQNENPDGRAEADLKDAVVRLPEGMAVNPSSANGLGACSAAQIGYKLGTSGPAEFTPNAAECPDASRIGNVEVDTPLLDRPLKGGVFIARPHDNPFDSLLAIYIAVHDPQSGVVVKLAGHVVADPNTGQLTTTFSDNPQLPFEDFKLDFFGGPRAALVTPPTCGTYATTTDMTPWSAPQSGPDAHPGDSFPITSGPNGSACANSPGEQPNSPSFSAGTLTPLAGAYSPFVLHLRREDGSQRFSTIDTVLPPGLVGKLAGIPYCPQAAIDLTKSREHEGGGAEEQANPSCPAASRVGAVNVGAGAGPQPYYVQGSAYLAGPYKGAALSLVIVTPAVAGPYDLGTVVIQVALHVDPVTAQITAKSDPIPQILHGIPLDVRSVALKMDRPDFTLNPTSCEAMSVGGTETSTLGQSASLSDRFQVGACNALDFKPKLGLRLFGKTNRGAHPRLRAVLTMPKGGADIARAAVALPHSELLDQGHIGTFCTRVQFAEGSTPGERCPAASIYGFAKAWSPLLDQPLQGPVYLRSSNHNLPDLVAALNGQIQIALDGRIDSVHGGIRNTFEVVPDAPVTKFILSMRGGRKGLLVNSTNLCAKPQHATARFDAQNGKISDFNPVVKADCGGGGRRVARTSAVH